MIGNIINKDTVQELTLFSDLLMRSTFQGNIPATELLLRIIMGIPSLTVDHFVDQKVLANLYGRSLTLDLYAKDDTGKIYNVEVQSYDYDELPRRARFHSALQDLSFLPKSQEFSALPEQYTIFIVQRDCFHEHRPMYHYATREVETGDTLDDGRHILFVNGEIQDPSTALGRLMQDFSQKDPHKFNYEEIGQRIDYLKNTKEGVSTMSKDVRDIYELGVEEGVEKGREEGMQKGREEGREEGMQKGREEGMQKGREEGMQKGREEGMQKGRFAALLSSVRSLVATTKKSPEEVMDMMGVNAAAERASLLKAL